MHEEGLCDFDGIGVGICLRSGFAGTSEITCGHINAHLLTEKEKYFGAIPFRPMTPSEHRGTIYSERFEKAGRVCASQD